MPQTQEPPKILLPQFSLAGEIDSALPLERTTVRAQLTGPLADVQVAQRFTNPLSETADLDYLFPLPEDAAITAFDLLIGTRRVQGDLRELEDAREQYQQAQSQGKRAALLEQRRPNLLAVRLANVRPGEAIEAHLRYQQRLKFEDDSYTFVFPMGITPRYNSPTHPYEGDGLHAPLAGASEKIGTLEIEVHVDAGVELAGEPRSPSHPLEITGQDARHFQARLAGAHIPDHDFVLRYQVASDQLKTAAWTRAKDNNLLFLAALLPPRLEEEPTLPPREFVFVLDRSGSMSGEPILQARNALRACLRSTGPEDTVRILLFDDQLEWYQKEPFKVTQKELEKADAFLSNVAGRGGTEIIGAIEAALKLPQDRNRARFVVFLTDGAVSAEERALDQIRSRIGSARIFTFGIGPSVNRALLSRMARLGSGRAEFLQLDEDIEGAIIRFQDSVSFPTLTDITLHWENGQAWDVYPSRLPDLYSGQPLEICGFAKRSGAGPLRLKLQGRRAGQPVTLHLELPSPAAEEDAASAMIDHIWARARVDDLMEQQELDSRKTSKIRAEILGLAIEYHLVTELTAFVAVDSQADPTSGQARIIHISQPLPKGLSRQPFASLPPSPMSMPAAVPPPSAMPGRPLSRSMPPQGIQRILRPTQAGGPAPDLHAMAPSAAPGRIAESALPILPGPQEQLRLLARSQRADGSWGGDAGQTAAALLAFIRAGETTRSGSFRAALRKALQWLKNQQLNGLAACLRVRVLEELAKATTEPADLQAASQARQALPHPANPLESAALDSAGQPPTEITTLDDLRLAVLLKITLPAPPTLLQGPHRDIALAWIAAMR